MSSVKEIDGGAFGNFTRGGEILLKDIKVKAVR
jgi:hypothetical protein